MSSSNKYSINMEMIGERNFYYKILNKKANNKEIVCNKLCRGINLLTPEYESVLLDDKYKGYSLDLNSLGTFDLASEITCMYFESINILDLTEKVFYKYGFSEKLYEDIIKMYIFDFIIMNCDRHDGNFGFLTKKNESSLYVFDHDRAFTFIDIPVLTNKDYDEFEYQEILMEYYSFMTKEANTYNDMAKFYLNNFHLEMKAFYKNIPSKYHEIIIDVFKKYNPEFILNEIVGCIDLHIIKYYEKIYEKMYTDVIVRQRYF